MQQATDEVTAMVHTPRLVDGGDCRTAMIPAQAFGGVAALHLPQTR